MILVLADFLDSLLRGALLVGLSLSVGSVAWALAVLGVGRRCPPESTVARTLALLQVGAVGVAVCQAALLVLKVLVLTRLLGPDALGSFLLTLHAAAGGARVVLALGVTAVAAWVRRAPGAGRRWAALAAAAALLVASGAGLTHAMGRVEGRALLAALTVLHQAAAAVWVGGLLQLAGAWRLARHRPEVDIVWPDLVARFSRLALCSVAALVVTALPLGWMYTGSVSGLVGTGYGSLMILKAMLLAAVLVLAVFNRSTARRRAAPPPALRQRLPWLVDAELIVVVAILVTAATLSSQPPPLDAPATERATLAEVAEVFRPKIPGLHTPSVEAMRRTRAAAAPGGERTREAYLWSNFSHNVAGLIVLAMSLVALAGFAPRARWARHWPLGFIGLAAFIYLRAAANEGSWPFGTVALAAIDGEGLQHRIAVVLVIGLGLVEWRARARARPGSWLPYVFPALAAAGAVLLLTHSHTAFQLKAGYLVQVTHATMGALAALMVAARWLELRLGPPAARVAGAAACLAMMAVALVLVFYREANVLVGPG